MHQSFQLNLWTDFLAGRVPRRKNFAGSFKITRLYYVKQGFSHDATYSQGKAIFKSLSNFYRAAQNHIKQSQKNLANLERRKPEPSAWKFQTNETQNHPTRSAIKSFLSHYKCETINCGFICRSPNEPNNKSLPPERKRQKTTEPCRHNPNTVQSLLNSIARR